MSGRSIRFDTTVNGRTIKLLNIIDECTRESFAIVVDRSIDADTTVTALEKAFIDRGRAPEFIRCDNGPELTAHALTDWCKTSDAGTHSVDPGTPWQNAWIESFNSRLRDECLAIEEFTSLLEARINIAIWRRDYNDYRPHSARGMLTSTAFAARQPQPTLSWAPDQEPGASQSDNARACALMLATMVFANKCATKWVKWCW